MSQIVLPYCYKITNIHTNQFYICFRSANKVQANLDLGFKYFTSSKTVKELGFSNFKIDWIEDFSTPELAYDWEQMMIYVNLKDPLCLNKVCYFKTKKFSNIGLNWKLSEETKLKISKIKKGKSSNRKGIKHSEETKQKMSKATKGIKRKPLSNDHKLKISKANLNPSNETRQKISLSVKNRSKEINDKISKSLKGKSRKPFSEDHKRKLSEAKIGKIRGKYKKN